MPQGPDHAATTPRLPVISVQQGAALRPPDLTGERCPLTTSLCAPDGSLVPACAGDDIQPKTPQASFLTSLIFRLPDAPDLRPK